MSIRFVFVNDIDSTFIQKLQFDLNRNGANIIQTHLVLELLRFT